MNYSSPYFSSPSMGSAGAPGLFSTLTKGSGINWGSLLSNTQKTIGIINQAIPMFKQVSPMVRNAKTMFKVMNEFKKDEPSASQNKVEPVAARNTRNTPTQTAPEKEVVQESVSDAGPRFFV